MNSKDQAKKDFRHFVAEVLLADRKARERGSIPLLSRRSRNVLDAIRAFLRRNNAGSLDQALGLSSGKRGKPKKYIELVARAIPLRERKNPMQWGAICGRLNYRGKPDQFAKLYHKHADDAFVLYVRSEIGAPIPHVAARPRRPRQ